MKKYLTLLAISFLLLLPIVNAIETTNTGTPELEETQTFSIMSIFSDLFGSFAVWEDWSSGQTNCYTDKVELLCDSDLPKYRCTYSFRTCDTNTYVASGTLLEREKIAFACPSGKTCKYTYTVQHDSSAAEYIKHFSRSCYGGDVWYYDSDDRRTDKLDDCISTCEAGRCVDSGGETPADCSCSFSDLSECTDCKSYEDGAYGFQTRKYTCEPAFCESHRSEAVACECEVPEVDVDLDIDLIDDIPDIEEDIQDDTHTAAYCEGTQLLSADGDLIKDCADEDKSCDTVLSFAMCVTWEVDDAEDEEEEIITCETNEDCDDGECIEGQCVYETDSAFIPIMIILGIIAAVFMFKKKR